MQPIKYFKTYGEAKKVADTVDPSLCVNKYQVSKDIKQPKIVEFKKGYAVQFGDCGEYLTQ